MRKGKTGRASGGRGSSARCRRAGRDGSIEGGTQGFLRRRRPIGAIGGLAMAALLALTAGLALLAPAPAQAIIPVTDYAHIAVNQYWHYVHYVQFALRIYQEYQALTNQYRQIVNQLLALKKLANPNWREVYDLLANLDWIMRQGQALAYSYKNIDAQFQQAFPGFAEIQNWPVQRQVQAVRTLDTMRTALDTVSEQFRHDIADQLLLERIKGNMDGIHGHQEALELQSTILMYTAQELGVVKQSLATANNMQAVYYGHQINREAQAEATLAAGLTRTLATNSREPAPGYGALPSWWPGY
jgi:P-type conjugative transfer protein TrbJ